MSELGCCCVSSGRTPRRAFGGQELTERKNHDQSSVHRVAHFFLEGGFPHTGTITLSMVIFSGNKPILGRAHPDAFARTGSFSHHSRHESDTGAQGKPCSRAKGARVCNTLTGPMSLERSSTGSAGTPHPAYRDCVINVEVRVSSRLWRERIELGVAIVCTRNVA